MTGERYTLFISDMNENGVGITRVGRMAVFIPGTAAGDTAEFEIVSVEKNYAVGRLIRLIGESPDRIPDECPESRDCGGCTLGHISFEAENRVKRGTVASAFRRSGLDPSLVEETLAAPERTGYRNKLTVHYDEGSGCFGLFRGQSTEVLPFTGCALCPPVMSELVRFTNAHPELLRDCKPESLVVRTSESGVTVSVYTAGEKSAEKYGIALRQSFPEAAEVLTFASGQNSGEAHTLSDSIDGLRMRFSTEAFRQVNRSAFELLLSRVAEFAGAEPITCGVDLYCGSGIIGLALAKRFPEARFWGIELNPDAISDAKRNAADNGIGNIAFFCGDSAAFRKMLPKELHPDWVTVDPPRAGLSKKMRQELAELSPRRLCYISCNPQTLARDLAELAQSGYAVERAIPVNLFPRTRHVEVVCLAIK